MNIWQLCLDLLRRPQGPWLAGVPVWQPRRLGVAAALVRLIKENINEGLLCYTGYTQGWLSKRHLVRGCNGINMADLLCRLCSDCIIHSAVSSSGFEVLVLAS